MKLQCFLSGAHLKAPGSLRQPPQVGLTLHTSSDGLIVESSRILFQGFPSGSGKESICYCRRHGFDPWVGRIPWRRKWQATPVFLPGKFHGQRKLVGYSPPARKELDTSDPPSTQRLPLPRGPWSPLVAILGSAVRFYLPGGLGVARPPSPGLSQ